MDCVRFETRMIHAVVGALIERRGYYDVIDELIAEVYSLGEISLSDPDNTTKLREFDIWAQAVRAAILKHADESTFANQITPSDHEFAKQVGFVLE